jgi:hypothetical protein
MPEATRAIPSAPSAESRSPGKGSPSTGTNATPSPRATG